MFIENDLIWMSLVVFLPAVMALVLLLFPRGWEKATLWFTLAVTAVTFGLSIGLFMTFKADVIDQYSSYDAEARRKSSLDQRVADLENASVAAPAAKESRVIRYHKDWVTRHPWIERFNIEYYMGVDGISLPLILLTTLLGFLSMIASFGIKRYEGKERFVKGYCALYLVLETGILGTFLALDFFLFYIFWEVMLLPMYFLIGVWGGPRREYAAIKFFLYTLFGSVLILIALLGFYFTDVRDFVQPRVHDARVERIQKERGISAAEAREKASVNSFDFIVLARAGKAALQYIGNDKDISAVTTAPAVEEQRKELRRLEADHARKQEALDAVKDQGGKEAAALRAELKQLRAERRDVLKQVHTLEDGLRERMDNQWFFTPTFQITMFLLLFIGFAIKVPVFPFHTWLPDAHVEAPTPISMILAGILLKLGGYGILRVAYPICPWAAYTLATWLALFGVINIVYGAFAAMAQTDFKKLVAYSSISHMGYVLLGIAVWSTNTTYWNWGVNGAMFQMIAHGITSAGMFFLVGVIYDRAHHRNLDNFRGIYEPMPLYGGISAVIFFAAMGLPGMCGFVGEFFVILSTFNFAPDGQRWIGITFGVLSAVTVVLTAAYILWTLQRVFMGENAAYKNYSDMTVAELVCILPLVLLSIALGVLPGYLLLNWMEPSIANLVDALASFR